MQANNEDRNVGLPWPLSEVEKGFHVSTAMFVHSGFRSTVRPYIQTGHLFPSSETGE